MSQTIPLPVVSSAKSVGLEVWMERVLDRVDKIEPRWKVDDIHDLRVALRRSRAMAEALSQVNPAPEWRKLKKGTREIFHAMGEVRDTQIARSWVRKLGPASDLVRKHMLGLLSHQEREQRRIAKTALEDFDRRDWRKWKRRLAPKARFFPLESVVFQRLALARLEEAFDLYQQARQKRSGIAWHRVRIGIKHFRYIAENFLPRRYASWEADLKSFQDLLGEVHDLDVLRAGIRKQGRRLGAARIAPWLEKIEGERKIRLKEFMRRSVAEDSPWSAWRRGFQQGHALVAASFPERRSA
jgi:CHAD domain-containing protein